jgi:23S rRNA (adenine2503-C2)-methyltransferase
MTHGLRWPPLRNVVFMGMGEPLDNLRQVETAVDAMTDTRLWGIGPRRVTVSTVGPSVAAVERVGPWAVHLAWSLHAARDDVRTSLVPTQSASVEAIADAFRRHRRSRPPFVEITLVDGMNDGDDDADAAARLMSGFDAQVRFNLLPVNPNPGGHRPPPPSRIDAFASVLRRHGHRVMVRRARGDDLAAACGQLVVLRS